MFVEKVQASQKPVEFQYDTLPNGISEVWIRENIHEVETDDGRIFEYSEIFFVTDEAEEVIREDLVSWAEYGREWVPTTVPEMDERMDIIEARVDYLFMMEDL